VVSARFDFEGFYRALDAVRRAQERTWRDVAHEAGVSASSVSRLAQGSRPDVDTVVALATWSALDLRDFVPNRRSDSLDTFGSISSYLRRDPNLTAEGAAALEKIILASYAQFKRAPRENRSGER